MTTPGDGASRFSPGSQRLANCSEQQNHIKSNNWNLSRRNHFHSRMAFFLSSQCTFTVDALTLRPAQALAANANGVS